MKECFLYKIESDALSWTGGETTQNHTLKPQGQDDNEEIVYNDLVYNKKDGLWEHHPKVRRRRLGWKPSHDIPRRREGFHHSFTGIIQETE